MANRTTLRRKQRLHAEIFAFANKHGGSNLDLDEELEQAGVEALQAADRQRTSSSPCKSEI
jgi:hypothetical protein